MTHRAVRTSSQKVVVAVKAEKVISRTALAWALSHVVRPGDCITLLAVFSCLKTGRKLWSFPRLTRRDRRNEDRENLPDRIGQITESCSQMVLQFNDQIEARVQIKVVSAATLGTVAAEAKNSAASWVVLDKKLKKERLRCMEELQCNIVQMKGSQPKVLRLSLARLNEPQTPFFSAASSPHLPNGKLRKHKMMHSTPMSSPEEPSTSFTRTTTEYSLSSPETVSSLFLIYEENPLFEGLSKGKYTPFDKESSLENPLVTINLKGETDANLPRVSKSSVTSNHKSMFWISQNHIVDDHKSQANYVSAQKNQSLANRTPFDRYAHLNQDSNRGAYGVSQVQNRDYMLNSSIREAVSINRTSSISPPLCSSCQHKAPAFGKPPRRFEYEELQKATDGFSDMNFLAEGGFGLVHRGVLKDGLVVAVKQLKYSGFQGDSDFCREVRVLSCAQHRNVVLLIGFCIDGEKRILVYEYICNGSLDFHLHGNKRAPLDWPSRLKIAIGAARGLRYLHEDCRVGCIIHRDMRPNNILLTHDYEPLVSDFGLARLHNEVGTSDEERLVGTSGYLAPEYLNGEIVTEKVDIYAFGLVLLELLAGQKATDLQSYRNQYSSPGNLFVNTHQLLDPTLAFNQHHNLTHEQLAMGRAVSLCLQTDPDFRPSMSKVLRILEGGDAAIPLSMDVNSIGNRSAHMPGLRSNMHHEHRNRHSRKLSH